MNSRQLGVLLLVYLAVQALLGSLAGLSAIPRTLGTRSLTTGDIAYVGFISLVAVGVFGIAPAAVILRYRESLARRWFRVTEESVVVSIGPVELLTVGILLAGLTTLLYGISSLPTVAMLRMNEVGSASELASLWGPTFRIASGVFLIARGRRVAEYLLKP